MTNPDALLESIRRLCRSILSKATANRQHHTTINDETLDAADCLAQNVQNLDEHLRRGDPLPTEWRRT